MYGKPDLNGATVCGTIDNLAGKDVSCPSTANGSQYVLIRQKGGLAIKNIAIYTDFDCDYVGWKILERDESPLE